jgi:hypothetical protein
MKTFDAADGDFVTFECNIRRHPLVLAATLDNPSIAISLVASNQRCERPAGLVLGLRHRGWRAGEDRMSRLPGQF